MSRSPSSGPLKLDSQMDLDGPSSRGTETIAHPPHKALSASPPTSSSQLPYLPVETIPGMPSTRRFRFQGPFGVQFTIATRIPGKLKVSLRGSKSETSVPGSNARSKRRFARRATTEVDFDVVMGNNPSQSVSHSATGSTQHVTDSTQHSSSSQPIDIYRSLSRRGTEIIEGVVSEPASLEDPNISINPPGNWPAIKVRDFAFPAPTKFYATNTSGTGPSDPTQLPIPRIFDPLLDLCQYDCLLSLPAKSQNASPIPPTHRRYKYRFTANPHPRPPIQGSILRRLVDLSWVTLEEAQEKWAPQDWEELHRYDAIPPDQRHPWRPFSKFQHPEHIPVDPEEARQAGLQTYRDVDGLYYLIRPMQIPTPEERVKNTDIKSWYELTEEWIWEDRLAKAGPEEKAKLLAMDTQRDVDLGWHKKHRKLPPMHLEVHDKKKGKGKETEVVSPGTDMEEMEVAMHLSCVESPRPKRKRRDDEEEDNVDDIPRTKKRKLAFATQPVITWPPHPRPTQSGDRPPERSDASTSAPTPRLRYNGTGEVMEVVHLPQAQNQYHQEAPRPDPRPVLQPGDPTPPASPEVAPQPRWRNYVSTPANVASSSTGSGTRQHQAASTAPLRSAMRTGPSSRQRQVRVLQPHEEGYRPDNLYLPVSDDSIPLAARRTRTFARLE